MNMAWGEDGVGAEQGAPVSDGAVPEDKTAHGAPLESSVETGVQSTLAGSKSQKVRRSAMLAFEREMKQFSDQVRFEHCQRHGTLLWVKSQCLCQRPS